MTMYILLNCIRYIINIIYNIYAYHTQESHVCVVSVLFVIQPEPVFRTTLLLGFNKTRMVVHTRCPIIRRRFCMLY